MKTSLILVLAAALFGSAYFTRPSEESFKTISQTPSISLSKSIEAGPEYKDRYVFTVVKKDGKTAYIGAFGHWFDLTGVKEAPAPKVDVKLPV